MASSFYKWCADDRDFLMDNAGRHYGRLWGRPSQAVRHCCLYIGFRPMLSRRLNAQQATIDFEAGIIRLNPVLHLDSGAFLAGAGARPGDRLAEVLARQLGHVRLHERELSRGLRTPEQEREAEAYARIFLLPQKTFRPAAEGVIRSSARAREVAKEWGVSPKVVRLRAREVVEVPRVEIEGQVELHEMLLPSQHKKEGMG